MDGSDATVRSVELETSTVLVVEPHDICRRVLGWLLSSCGGSLSLIGEARDLHSGILIAQRENPDLVLLGVLDGAGMAVVTSFLDSVGAGTQLVVLSDRSDGESVIDVMRRGARGFVPKSADPEVIVEALSRVARGEVYVHPGVAGDAVAWASGRQLPSSRDWEILASLTKREREVLDLMLVGHTPSAIATRLVISRRTVESHLASSYRKLGVHGCIPALHVYGRLRKSVSNTSAG